MTLRNPRGRGAASVVLSILLHLALLSLLLLSSFMRDHRPESPIEYAAVIPIAPASPPAPEPWRPIVRPHPLQKQEVMQEHPIRPRPRTRVVTEHPELPSPRPSRSTHVAESTPSVASEQDEPPTPVHHTPTPDAPPPETVTIPTPQQAAGRLLLESNDEIMRGVVEGDPDHHLDEQIASNLRQALTHSYGRQRGRSDGFGAHGAGGPAHSLAEPAELGCSTRTDCLGTAWDDYCQ